jgi:hypothetical protein
LTNSLVINIPHLTYRSLRHRRRNSREDPLLVCAIG